MLVGAVSAVAQSAPKTQPPLKKDAAAKSVGVISAVGGTFHLQKIGITVFGNESHAVPVEAWGLDELITARVAVALGQRYQVKRINVPKGVFTAYETPGGLFRDRDAELRDAVRKAAAGHPSDLYVVVTKGYSSFGTSNQGALGLGLVVAGSALVDSSYLHALSTVRLYNGKTFEVLGWQHASMGQPTFMMTIKGPHKQVDSSWWPSGQPASDARLKDATRKLVEQSITMTIPSLMKAAGEEIKAGSRNAAALAPATPPPNRRSGKDTSGSVADR